MKNIKINWRAVFGEILIVTIGILIAFGLNNWAQSRADAAETKAYFANIKQDIEKDTIVLDSLIKEVKKFQRFSYKIFGHFGRELPGRDTIPAMFFKNSIKGIVFRPHQSTYESLISSGDLKKIRSFELKNQLVEFYNSYEDVVLYSDRMLDFFSNVYSPFFMNEVNQGEVFAGNGQPELLDNFRFRNIVMSLYGMSGILEKEYLKAKENGKEMISVLERY